MRDFCNFAAMASGVTPVTDLLVGYRIYRPLTCARDGGGGSCGRIVSNLKSVTSGRPCRRTTGVFLDADPVPRPRHLSYGTTDSLGGGWRTWRLAGSFRP